MIYKERHARRAFALVRGFIDDKVRQDVRPDMVYHELIPNARGLSYAYRERDAWIITIRDDKCIMAVKTEDLTTVIVGELKLRRRLFGGDRSEASSYAHWREYWEMQASAGMDTDLADTIIDALTPPA